MRLNKPSVAFHKPPKPVSCRVSFVPNIYNIPLQTITVDTLAGIPLLSIKQRPALRPMPMTKRLFDIVFSVLVLSTVPVWPVVVLLIRFSSKGPIFFSQKRIGQGGKPFMMWKFRTMYVDAHPYAQTPQNSTDHRITPSRPLAAKVEHR